MPVSTFDNQFLDITGDLSLAAGTNVATLQATPTVGAVISQYALQVSPVSGFWYPNYVISTGAAGTPASVGQIHAYPYPISKAHIYQAMAVDVTTAGSVATIQYGVYADSGSGTPGNLVQLVGTATANATGAASVAAQIPLSPVGNYWLAGVLLSAAASPTLNSDTSSRNNPVFGQSAVTATLGQSSGWKSTATTFTTGLPSVFPTAITAELAPFFQILA